MRGTNLLLALMLMTLTVACSLGDAGPDPCDAGGALLQDDFDGEEMCGWSLYNQGGTVVEITDGVLQMSTSQPGQIWWTNPGRQFSDVIVTVQARQVNGPDDNAYGVICRYQNEENFYLFLISGDGFYMIGKYQSGTNRVIYLTGDGEFQFSEIINQGVATNQVRASCVGNELTLSVNGIALATVVDDSFATGDVGLGVSTFELGTAVVHFDDLRVLAP